MKKRNFKITLVSFSLISFLAPQTVWAKPAPNAAPKKAEGQIKLFDVKELQVEDTKVGTGADAKNGQNVKVHYTGMLTNGKKFDSSVDRGTPFTFMLGAGNVIQGWEKGIAGVKEKKISPMKIGGKRILRIPAKDGYGPSGYPPVIPANATLTFSRFRARRRFRRGTRRSRSAIRCLSSIFRTG